MSDPYSAPPPYTPAANQPGYYPPPTGPSCPPPSAGAPYPPPSGTPYPPPSGTPYPPPSGTPYPPPSGTPYPPQGVPYDPSKMPPPSQPGQPSYQQYSVTVQPTQQVIIGGCPACRVGVLEDDFTCLGVFCAIMFFPIGILCCLAMRQRRCSNCGAIYG